MKYGYTLAAALLLLGACDGSTGPGGGGNIAIRFGTSASSNVLANVQLSGSASSANDLTVTGTNGTLVIQDIRFIVSRLELERTEGTACKDSSGEGSRSGNLMRADNNTGDNGREQDSECDEFQGGPFLVDLPLTGLTSIATDNVPAGTYDAFSFRIRGLDSDTDDDASEKQIVPGVLTEIRTFYPNFPSNASMVVKGTFNGTPFTTYFRAKMKIEQKLDKPLNVPGDKSIQVMIDPSAWFKNGTLVLDLQRPHG